MTEPLTPEARLAALLHVEIRDKGWASCVHSPEGEWLPFCAEIAARLIAAGVTLDAARQPAAEAALREVPPWDDAAKSWSSRLPVLLDIVWLGRARQEGQPNPRYLYPTDTGPAHAALREMARLADAALAATPAPQPAPPDEALREALDLIADMAPDYHHNGLVRDHADPTDKTGWNVKDIETCADSLCVEALRLQSLIPTRAASPSPQPCARPHLSTAPEDVERLAKALERMAYGDGDFDPSMPLDTGDFGGDLTAPGFAAAIARAVEAES